MCGFWSFYDPKKHRDYNLAKHVSFEDYGLCGNMKASNIAGKYWDLIKKNQYMQQIPSVINYFILNKKLCLLVSSCAVHSASENSIPVAHVKDYEQAI